jgi:hypothetical protein
MAGSKLKQIPFDSAQGRLSPLKRIRNDKVEEGNRKTSEAKAVIEVNSYRSAESAAPPKTRVSK